MNIKAKKSHKNIVWHVFTDGLDDWVNTLAEAQKIFSMYKAEGYENIRIYRETYESGKFLEQQAEDCIKSLGNFPY